VENYGVMEDTLEQLETKILSDIITKYVQNQGDQEEKQAYKQMKIIDF